MKQSINIYQFREAFIALDRGDQFSWNGYNALFDWLEEVDEGEHELDVIALCCDFTEYESAQNAHDNVFATRGGKEEEECFEELNENTCVIHFEGGIIIRAF